MTAETIGRTIPEFADVRTEAAYRTWSGPDTVRQARAALWLAVLAVPAFAINDITLHGIGPAATAQLALRCVVVTWSLLLLLRLRRAIEAKALDRQLLAWAIAIGAQTIASAATRPPDFASNLMVVQTVLLALVAFCPLRIVPRAVNGVSFAVVLVMALWWTGAVASAMVVPLSIALAFVLVAGLFLVHHIERLRRQEFARMRREEIRMDELRAAKEAAEAADRAKTRFLAVVSHEVRTPMNGVLGVLQLMEGSRLDALQRRQVAIARDCAEGLTGLLDTIIDYARLGRSVEVPVPVDFEPRQLVHSVVELFEPRARAQQTTIEVRVAGDMPARLHADAGRLRQVLVNLLSNAVKFTERGRIAIVLALQANEAGERSLELVVEDSGIGIAPEGLARIFEEFTQADASVARRFGGTGLGLAVCKRVVGMLGGTIAATSEPGTGSRFCVTVPVAVAAAAVDAAYRPPVAGRLRVLVVDDDPINQIVACGLLAQLGHDAAPATGGGDALAVFASERFDAVLMDLHMPLMDGFEATRRIRALATPGQAAVPVIALSADVLLVQDARFAECGLSGMLAKPLRRDALRSALAAIDAGTAPAPRSPALVGSAGIPVDLVHLGEQVEALGFLAVARLVHLFRRIGRRQLGELDAAVARGDSRRVAELAHRLGSAASALGLVRLCRLADCLEQAAQAGTAPEGAALVAALATEFSRALAALRDLAHEARAVQRATQASRLTLESSR